MHLRTIGYGSFGTAQRRSRSPMSITRNVHVQYSEMSNVRHWPMVMRSACETTIDDPGKDVGSTEFTERLLVGVCLGAEHVEIKRPARRVVLGDGSNHGGLACVLLVC